MIKIEIPVPDCLADDATSVELFFRFMMTKLETNRHKTAREPYAVYVRNIAKEFTELQDALVSKPQMNVVEEAADVANTALLLAAVVLSKTRPEHDFAADHFRMIASEVERLNEQRDGQSDGGADGEIVPRTPMDGDPFNPKAIGC